MELIGVCRYLSNDSMSLCAEICAVIRMFYDAIKSSANLPDRGMAELIYSTNSGDNNLCSRKQKISSCLRVGMTDFGFLCITYIQACQKKNLKSEASCFRRRTLLLRKPSDAVKRVLFGFFVEVVDFTVFI